MVAELAIFKCLASVEVQDRHIPVVKERGWVLASGSRGWCNDIGLWELGTGAVSYGRQHQIEVSGEIPAVKGLG